MKLGWIDQLHRLPRRPVERALVDRSSPTSGAASPSSRSRCWPACRPSRRRYYEAAALDGATPWQQFRYITLPLLTPIIAVVMTFSVLFTFTDFQLIYVLTRGGPLNATHLMATLSFQRAIPGGALGEGAAIATPMVPVPAGRDPVQLLRPAAPRLAAGRSDKMSMPHDRDVDDADIAGHGLPAVRCRARVVTIYLPLGVFVFVLLFPFYWMAITVVQAERRAAVARRQPVLGHRSRRWRTSRSCCSTPPTRTGCGTRCWCRWCRPFLSLVAQRARRLRDRAAALPRLAATSAWRSSSPTWCRRRSCSSRWRPSSSSSACSTRGWR